MKTLLVIRHANAEVGFGLKDFDRSLSDRGKSDAPVMAQKVADKKINIDVFISSSAKRTKQTCTLFCKALHKKEEDIILTSDLYHAPANTFYDVIEDIDNQLDTAAIFGHNPGITSFVNSLTEDINIGDMPTCGVFAVTANIESWNEFAAAAKKFLFFDYPKNV
jgi:phosphohistidine phosphatase